MKPKCDDCEHKLREVVGECKHPCNFELLFKFFRREGMDEDSMCMKTCKLWVREQLEMSLDIVRIQKGVIFHEYHKDDDFWGQLVPRSRDLQEVAVNHLGRKKTGTVYYLNFEEAKVYELYVYLDMDIDEIADLGD